jgi:MGT family glycosyltransferase
MARFLFTVPPLAGHVNPTISLGRELRRRGHDVAWAGPPGELAGMLPDGCTFMPVGSPVRPRPAELHPKAAFRSLWQDVLIPMGHTMAGDLDKLVEWWSPDVLVADQQALAGAVVARRRGLRWATSATTSSELIDPLSAFPSVTGWVRDQLAAFQSALGVPESEATEDPRFSEHLVLVYSTRRLIGEHHQLPPHYAFVGPSIDDRPSPEPFPWDWLDPHVPHVLVTLGTTPIGGADRFFAVVTEALAGARLQAVLVAPPHLLGDREPAGNVLAQERVPQLALLRSMQAVVCHGGHNTVCEALAHGLPLVVAPVHDDQPVIANQVAEAGAGIRVRFARVGPLDLRRAVREVLIRPGYRKAASAIRESFRAAGGTAEAASRLEALAGRHLGAGAA